MKLVITNFYDPEEEKLKVDENWFFKPHRLKYKGWKLVKETNETVTLKNGYVELMFREKGRMSIMPHPFNIIHFPCILSEETFDLLMKDLGIKIEKV